MLKFHIMLVLPMLGFAFPAIGQNGEISEIETTVEQGTAVTSDPENGNQAESSSQEETNQGGKLPLPIEANRFYDADGRATTTKLDPFAMQIIRVPVDALPVDLSQSSANLWVRGDQPAENLLARVEFAASAEATATIPDGTQLRLLRAKRDEASGVHEDAPEDIASTGAIYCTDASFAHSASTLHCLIDIDEDGAFDAIGPAASESRLGDAFGAAVLGATAKLLAPLPYEVVADADRESVTFEWRNCAKDWDRPRFSISLVSDSSEDAAETDIELLLRAADPSDLSADEMRRLVGILGGIRRSTTTSCQAGNQVSGFRDFNASDLEEKSILVSLRGLYFIVGAKRDGAPVQLVGESLTTRSFRIEGGILRNARAGLTPIQRRLVNQQRFPKPPFMSTGALALADQKVGIGEEIMTVPFRHGYVARLTDDSSIRTLLTSRSLDEGTLVYGVPMTSRRVSYYGGVPRGLGMPQPAPSTSQTNMTWCAPVRDERNVRTGTRGYGGPAIWEKAIVWKSTCITMVGSQHTIVKGQQPAFILTGLRHEAQISTNDGNPPLERLETADFGGPLQLRYVLTQQSERHLGLRQEVWIGEQKSSERDFGLLLDDGRAEFNIGGGTISFVALGSTDEGASTAGIEATLLKPLEDGGAIDVSPGRTVISR